MQKLVALLVKLQRKVPKTPSTTRQCKQCEHISKTLWTDKRIRLLCPILLTLWNLMTNTKMMTLTRPNLIQIKSAGVLRKLSKLWKLKAPWIRLMSLSHKRVYSRSQMSKQKIRLKMNLTLRKRLSKCQFVLIKKVLFHHSSFETLFMKSCLNCNSKLSIRPILLMNQ